MLGVIMDHVHGRRVDVIEHILLLCGEHVVLLLAITSDSRALVQVFSQCVFSLPFPFRYRRGGPMITAVGPTIVYQRHLDQMVEQLWTAWEHPMDAEELASRSRGFCCRKLFRRCVAGWNLCVFRNRCGGREIPRKRGEWARPTDHSSALFVSHVIMYDGSRWYWPLHLPITTFLRAILASLSNYNST